MKSYLFTYSQACTQSMCTLYSTTPREFKHGLRHFRTPPSLSPNSIFLTSVPFCAIDYLTFGSWSRKWAARPWMGGCPEIFGNT